MPTKVKLFSDLTDSQVETLVDEWQNMGKLLSDYDYYFYKYKETCKKIKKLYEKGGYVNARKELVRWRQLYEKIKPHLSIIYGQACTNGKNILDKAEALYNNRITRTVSLKVATTVEAHITENPNIINNYSVSVKNKNKKIKVKSNYVGYSY